MTKNKVTFTIKSLDMKPEEISKELGIFPDYFHSPILKESGGTIPGLWQLNSELGEDRSLDAHIQKMMEKLSPVGAKISELSEGKNGVIYCIVESFGKDNGYFIPSNVLQELGRMGISLVVKTYL